MTDDQREILIDRIYETVETWSIKELKEFVISVLENSLDDLSDDELQEKYKEIVG